MRFPEAIRHRVNGYRSKLFYPVGRRLCACALAYLVGVLCAQRFAISFPLTGILCALLLAAAIWQKHTGRRALLPICLMLLAAGNCAAGVELAKSDIPTAPNTPLGGTVVRIESDYRVMLGDVRLPEGETTKRPVVVTLMNEEDASLPEPPKVGQYVSGIGRLFAQEDVRNPGGVDQRVRAICDGYELSGYMLPGWTAEGIGVFSLSEAFRRLRCFLAERLSCLFGEDAALFSALMLGETDQVDPELTGALRLTGTAHILSVSGMHLTMVSSAISALLRWLPIGRKRRCFLQAAVMLVYAGLTGFAIGTIRALIMQYVAMLARVRAKRYDPLTAISLAALIIMIVSPLAALSVGFQYSFIVVLGIHLLSQRLEALAPARWLREKADWMAEMMIISLSAQIAALPIQLSLYGYVPLLALPMNLLCSVIVPLLMIGGWGMLALYLVVPALALRGAGILVYPARLFEAASILAASAKGGVLRLPALGRASLLLFISAMALFSAKIRFGPWRYRAMGAALALMAALYLPKFNPAPRYVQLDVGQGDAGVIRSGRRAVVIDTGPAYRYDLLRYLRCEGLAVDALVLSHLDEDHAGALNILCSSEIGVNRVIMAERAMEDVASEAVIEGLALLEKQGIDVEYVKAGDSFVINGMQFDVLSPADEVSGSNERSLLLRVEAEGVKLLLTGDLTKKAEPQIVTDCDLLKVAHHGSKNASSTEFLDQASPEVAVISCGAQNSYGHPHARVLGNLETIGAQVLRTDESGCITVWLEEGLRTETFL